MKSRFLSGILLSLISIVSASATTVTFSTANSNFNGAGNSITFGSVTLTHIANLPDPTTVNTPSSPGFGVLELSCINAGCLTNDPLNPVAGTFNLVIDQTQPTVGSNTLSGVLSGSISLYNGIAQITWGSTSVNIGDIKYTLSQAVLNITTVPLPGNPAPAQLPTGRTTIQGTVEAIPEPSTYAMLGSALLGLGLLRRRKA
jgi:hypothetical protein